MRTLLILITLALTACTELPDNPFENDPPTPPVVTSVTPTLPREPATDNAEDAAPTCGITLDRLYGCKAACDLTQRCAGAQGETCLWECVAGVAAGSWCPFPAAQ